MPIGSGGRTPRHNTFHLGAVNAVNRIPFANILANSRTHLDNIRSEQDNRTLTLHLRRSSLHKLILALAT